MLNNCNRLFCDEFRAVSPVVLATGDSEEET